ncbi:MAG: ribose-phosphate pyrophosphokinase [Candidatus Levyibacteriota bacterium]
MKENPENSLPNTQVELYKSFSPKTVDPDSFEILTGRGNIPLAQAVGKLLGKIPDQPCSDFGDGETDVKIKPNLRGREVFVLQSMYPSQNDRIQEIIFMADASKRADAQEITAIIPYYAYARQDRKPKPRTPISASRVAKQIVGAGVDRIFTIDIHAEQSQGSIDQAWDNVYSGKLIIELIKRLNLENAVVLAADIGSVKRSEGFSARLNNGGADIAIVHKKRDVNLHDKSDAITLIGEVKNRPVILYDDLISTGKTLLDAAKLAKQNGATQVIAAAVHGIFVPDKDGRTLPEKLKDQNCPIDGLIITDTIVQKENVLINEKIKIASVAPILAVAILCYLTHNSISKRLID